MRTFPESEAPEIFTWNNFALLLNLDPFFDGFGILVRFLVVKVVINFL
jgi:hypothetical protein